MTKFINKIIFTLVFFTLLTGCFSGMGHVLAAEDASQAALEQELQDIQNQIDEYTKELSKTQSEKASLTAKIKQLQTKQQSLSLQIKQTAIKVNAISKQISSTESGIKNNELKQLVVKKEIANVLKSLNIANQNLILSLLAADGLSSGYNKIQEYLDLTADLNALLKQSRSLTTDLIKKQEVLEEQKGESDNLLKISLIQKDSLTETLSEHNELLAETKGQESNYQSIINDKKKRAAEIRNRIYELFNTTKQIDFGQAVDIAKWAGELTGVRPALLLAILTQESNLGKNVGTCNRAGDPPEKSWKVVMKPTRDHEPFKQIIDELGMDIDTTPISCPMRDKNGKQVGWGGALGPAQFIPSTWMGYRSKLLKLTGKDTANPWDIRDAFLISAIKLKNDGANGTDDGDWKAALKYFAGSVNLKYRFYADNVMATAKKYQADIDDL